MSLPRSQDEEDDDDYVEEDDDDEDGGMCSLAGVGVGVEGGQPSYCGLLLP